MPSNTLVVGGGLLLLFLLGGKKKEIVPGRDTEPEPEPDWGSEEDPINMGPVVGEFWHWNDMFVTGKLPLIHRPGDRRLMGVYNPVKSDNYLIAVVDSAIMEDGRYLVVSTSAMSGFPAFHPQA